MGNILVSQRAVNQIHVSLVWLCPFDRRHSSSLQSNSVVPKAMLSFISLCGPPYAKAPLKWGPRSKWHISLTLRMILFGKCKLNVLISFHCSLMLKMKELHRMIAFLYCFSILFCFTFHTWRLCPYFSSLKGKIPSFFSTFETHSSAFEWTSMQQGQSFSL